MKLVWLIAAPILLIILKYSLKIGIPALKIKAKSTDSKWDDAAVDLAEGLYYYYFKIKNRRVYECRICRKKSTSA